MSAAEQRMQKKINTLKRDIKTDEGNSNTKNTRRSTPSTRGSPNNNGSEDTESMTSNLKKRVNTLETDLKRRQETYLAREQTDTTRIRVLEQKLEKATS